MKFTFKKFLIIFVLFLFLINFVFAQTQQKQQQEPQQVQEDSAVKVDFEKTTITVQPPQTIFSSLFDFFKKFNDLILTTAPYILVILIILGGFMYLLSPIEVKEMIIKGHSYIKYAIFGYVILLLISLVFSIIQSIFGGPSHKF